MKRAKKFRFQEVFFLPFLLPPQGPKFGSKFLSAPHTDLTFTSTFHKVSPEKTLSLSRNYSPLSLKAQRVSGSRHRRRGDSSVERSTLS
jgi:hypothetical protein